MAGLIGVGRSTLGQASAGFQQGSALEQQKNLTGDSLKRARRAQTSQMVGSGGGLGASIGVANLMHPAGAAVGALQAAPGIAEGTIAPAGQLAAGVTEGLVPGAGAAGAGAGAAGGAAGGIGAATGAAGAEAAATGATTAATGGLAGGGAASAGALGAIGTVAMPLLIGAGAALALDQIFDIF